MTPNHLEQVIVPFGGDQRQTNQSRAVALQVTTTLNGRSHNGAILTRNGPAAHDKSAQPVAQYATNGRRVMIRRDVSE